MCVHYIEGCSVHRGVFSTSRGYHDECGGYHVYIRGCSVHRRDTMSTSGGCQGYNGRSSVHWRDIMIHVGEQLDKILSISIENSDVLNIPRYTHDIPWYTHDIPWYTHGIALMYWKSPDVLMVFPTCIMISPRCTEHPPTGFSLVWGLGDPPWALCPPS